jgi:hypothetical protein
MRQKLLKVLVDVLVLSVVTGTVYHGASGLIALVLHGTI